MPDRIDYYIDGTKYHTRTENIPDAKGHLSLGHWSNGAWTGGPPLQDAVMTVGYVKAYFNTTTRDEPNKGCTGLSMAHSVCDVPAQLTAPNPDGTQTHFWSLAEPDHGNKELGNGWVAIPGAETKSDANAKTVVSVVLAVMFVFALCF